jgi:hypothetical protein
MPPGSSLEGRGSDLKGGFAPLGSQFKIFVEAKYTLWDSGWKVDSFVYKDSQLVSNAPGSNVQSGQTSTFNWGCDARPPDMCYFSIYYQKGGVQNFTMTAGQRDQIPGLVAGKDTYCVTVNQGFPNSKSCQRRIVKSDYNN